MQSPSLLRLAFKRLWRDARAGELRLLLIGVCLAVAAVTAVSLLVNRLEQGLLRDAAQLIGGDLVLTSDQPAPAWVRGSWASSTGTAAWPARSTFRCATGR